MIFPSFKHLFLTFFNKEMKLKKDKELNEEWYSL
jgi:hypothetical protein